MPPLPVSDEDAPADSALLAIAEASHLLVTGTKARAPKTTSGMSHRRLRLVTGSPNAIPTAIAMPEKKMLAVQWNAMLRGLSPCLVPMPRY